MNGLQVHLILRHKKPNGDIEEKHLDAPPAVNLDKLTHVYTAIIDTDNRYHQSAMRLQRQCSYSKGVLRSLCITQLSDSHRWRGEEKRQLV